MHSLIITLTVIFNLCLAQKQDTGRMPSIAPGTETLDCAISPSDCVERFGQPAKGQVTCNITSCENGQIQEVVGTYACEAGLQVAGSAVRRCVSHLLGASVLWTCTGVEPVCSIARETCPANSRLAYHFLCYGLRKVARGSAEAAAECQRNGAQLAEVVNEGLDRVLQTVAQDNGIHKVWVQSKTDTTTECSALVREDFVWSLRVFSGESCRLQHAYFCQSAPSLHTEAACSLLPHPDQGNRHGLNTQPGDSVTFSCNSGFRLRGSAMRTCTKEGLWDGEQPVCEADERCSVSQRHCEQLFGVPLGGSVACDVKRCADDASPVEIVGRYACDGVLRLDGQQQRICTKNPHGHEYLYMECSGFQPVCSIPRELCPESFHLSFGNFCYDIRRGPVTLAFAASQCASPGGKLADVNNRNTLSFLESKAYILGFVHLWLGSFRHPVSGLPNPTGSCASLEKSDFNQPWTLEAKTGSGCRLQKGYVCQFTPSSVARPDHCAVLPVPVNGGRDSQENHLGAEINFQCDSNFRLNGSARRVCLSSGLWSGEDSRCMRIDCGHPVHVTHGTASYTSTYAGATARYTCAENYVIRGNDVVTCLTSGGWSSPAPTCVVRDVSDYNRPSGTQASTHGLTTAWLIGILAALVFAGSLFGILISLLCRKRRKSAEPTSTAPAVHFSANHVPGVGHTVAVPADVFNHAMFAYDQHLSSVGASPTEAGPLPLKEQLVNEARSASAEASPPVYTSAGDASNPPEYNADAPSEEQGAVGGYVRLA